MLESFLASWRARQANRLIRDELRQGRILDIGCGSSPYFLSHTFFTEKFAVDRMAGDSKDIRWFELDLNLTPLLSFTDCYFSAVTMLAVIEHLNPDSLILLFRDVYRVLQPGGILIVTTPASWSDGLLHWMARVNLVSAEEIHEHVYAYAMPLIGWYFGKAGFEMEKIRFGYFEFGLNMWATAER